MTEAGAETILLNERNAWAFALRKIRPFLGKEGREYAINLIHQDALQSYSDGIRKQIAPRWQLLIPHLLQELQDLA